MPENPLATRKQRQRVGKLLEKVTQRESGQAGGAEPWSRQLSASISGGRCKDKDSRDGPSHPCRCSSPDMSHIPVTSCHGLVLCFAGQLLCSFLNISIHWSVGRRNICSRKERSKRCLIFGGVLHSFGDGQSGTDTRSDTGEVQENKSYYTHRSWRGATWGEPQGRGSTKQVGSWERERERTCGQVPLLGVGMQHTGKGMRGFYWCVWLSLCHCQGRARTGTSVRDQTYHTGTAGHLAGLGAAGLWRC